MRRLLPSVSIACLIVALTVSVVVALASGPPDNDSFVRTTSPGANFDTQDLSVAASSESCTPTETTYVQWDLTDIPGGETVNTATLTLTTVTVSGDTSSAMLSLSKTGDDWNGTDASSGDETTITSSNAPAVGDLIETQAAPTGSGQSVVFNSSSLASYINGEAAVDDIVSFALQFSSGCPAGVIVVIFEDAESAADQPDLQLRNPNAVRLQSLRATSASSEWDMMWELGLSVLGLTLIGGLVGQRARLFGLVACLPRQGECETRPSPGELRRA